MAPLTSKLGSNSSTLLLLCGAINNIEFEAENFGTYVHELIVLTVRHGPRTAKVQAVEDCCSRAFQPYTTEYC
jgi:hypothetical protein